MRPRLVLALIPTAALLLVSVAAADQLPPNELGRVMILEYHKIDYPEARWTRTPENFRRDLGTLYAKGYRLIALGDLLDGRIVLPAGTTPIVLTFDDSSPGQFRYIERNPGERFVSDGDPDTVTVPAELRDRLRSELPRHLRIVDR